MVNIEMSRTVANWILRMSIRLFQDGYNTNWTPSDPSLAHYEEGGYVDLIPLDNPAGVRWIEATMNLLRCLAAILHNQLQIADEDDVSLLGLQIEDDK